MNTPTSEFRPPISKRSAFRLGFTLVELLIVITVIGILVGLLLPAINSAVRTSRELAIRTEMVQIEQAIESFRTEYGFYPPSFEQFDRSTAGGVDHPGLSAFLRFLNRVAPNHQEASTANTFMGSAEPRVVDWWNNVGRFLDQQGSLVFWLSGLCESKQFPLTGGADLPIPAFNTSQYSMPVNNNASFTFGNGLTALPDGSPFEITRDVRFDFQPNQQLFATVAATALSGLTAATPNTNSGSLFEQSSIPANNVALVAAYKQPHGPSNGDLLYRYRDAGSYRSGALAYIKDFPGNVNGRFPGGDQNNPLIDDDFINPRTFQLISFGMDGDPGLKFDGNTQDEDEKRENAFALSTDKNFVKFGYDNMTNFADGRLELFVIENE